MILSGVGGGTGVALVEVYELTGGVTTPPSITGVYTGSISLGTLLQSISLVKLLAGDTCAVEGDLSASR